MPDAILRNHYTVFASAPRAGQSITGGLGHYDSPPIPAAAAFPNRSKTVRGVVTDDSGVPCARSVRAYDRETGALVDSTVSSAITGAFTLVVGASEVQRVVLDDSGGTLYNDIIDRVIPE